MALLGQAKSHCEGDRELFENSDHEIVEMLDLLAIFIAPIIIVVFARVANDMQNCLVVAHKVVGNIHEDTNTL